MRAIKRVRNARQQTVGFICDDGTFYNNYNILKFINQIENLKSKNDGGFRADSELPVVTYKSLLSLEHKRICKEKPLQRDIQKAFLDWKKHKTVFSNKALYVQGCRQSGKTTEIRKFAFKNYEYVIYIDISMDDIGFQNLLLNREGISIKRVMSEYCKRANLPEYEDSRRTVLIIDEIQNSKEVYNRIRVLKEGLKCDIIISGSYLSVISRDKGYFLPAGDLYYVTLFPLSFMEFSKVFKCEKSLKEIDLFGGSESSEYSKLFEIYNLYRQIGGYPSVIMSYIQRRSIQVCYKEIDRLLKVFKEESIQYFSEPNTVMAFDAVFSEMLLEMIKKKRGSGTEYIKDITERVKISYENFLDRRQVQEAIAWVLNAGIIGTCDLAQEGKLTNILRNRRIYFLDCGLLSYVISRNAINESAWQGLLTETFVFSELSRLHYANYDDDSENESDIGFFIEPKLEKPVFSILDSYELKFIELYDKTIYSIEIKTGKSSTKSLDEFMKRGFVNIEVIVENTEGKSLTIPIYTVGCRFPYIK